MFFFPFSDMKENKKLASQISWNPCQYVKHAHWCRVSTFRLRGEADLSKVQPSCLPGGLRKTDPAIVAEIWGCFQVSVHSEQTGRLSHCSPVNVSGWVVTIRSQLQTLWCSNHVCSFKKWARGSFCSPFCIVSVTRSMIRAGYILCIPQ